MKPTAKFYPFLISRNYEFDYRVIVSPRFVLDRKLLHVLFSATEDEGETKPGLVLHRFVSDGFTIIFRVEVATRQDIGENSSEILRDNGFRPINLVLGAVCEGIISGEQVRVADDDFKQIRNHVRKHYTHFWNQDNSNLFESDCLSVKFNTSDSPANFAVKSLPEYTVPSRSIVPASKQSNSRTRVDKNESERIARFIFLAILVAGFLVAASILSRQFFF